MRDVYKNFNYILVTFIAIQILVHEFLNISNSKFEYVDFSKYIIPVRVAKKSYSLNQKFSVGQYSNEMLGRDKISLPKFHVIFTVLKCIRLKTYYLCNTIVYL